jgi:hypothetical protein
MHSLNTWGLIRKRVANSRWLLASVFAGVLVSASLVSAIPVYISSLTQLSLNLEIDNLGRFGTTAFAFANNLILTESRFDESDQVVGDAIDRNLLPAYAGRERILGTHNLWIELGPTRVETGVDPPSGVVRHLSNVENYVTIISGRNAASTVLSGANGPIVEAIVSENAFDLFGLGVGDEVTVGVAEDAPGRVTLRIVGVADNSSFDGTLVSIASGFLNPPTQIDPELGPPPLPLFVTEQAITDAVGPIFRGIVVDAIWFIQFEPEVLKTWTGAETLERLDDFEREINTGLIGANITTPLRRIVNGAEARAFFARVPMLLLLAVLSVTVAFYLGMMVIYLVQSRNEDAALMRTRGVGFRSLLRIYSFEGLVVTVAAVVLSPLVAIAFVMAAGFSPSFSPLTDGGPLPFVPQITPFIIAVVVGLICLAVIVLPSALMARSGVLSQRFQSARPPGLSLFHRYYLDLLLLVLGGFVFWELQSRGELVSGGLFQDVEINEALLFAPVLFLVVVALVFMRLFPLLVRYLAGESPNLLHLTAAASLAILIPGTVMNGVRGVGETDWLAPVVILALFGAIYWGVTKTGQKVFIAVGIVGQAVLLWGFYGLDPPDSDSLLFWPFVALVGVVVGQVIYIFLKSFVRFAPVWVSMSLWHVARRPMQYTWLVVLVVLVTGVSILATTVGGTLEQSQVDRARYQAGGDIRVSMSRQYTGGVSDFRDNSKVALAAEAMRTEGTVGSISVEVLGIDSSQFDRISWYRDDFSDRPLDQIVAQLRPQAGSSRAVLPEGATSIGLWALPAQQYEGLMMNLLLSDAFGQLTTVFLGEVGAPEWKLMSTEIPVWLTQPLTLTAVHLQEPGAVGQSGRRAGTVLVDYIHATVGDDEQVIVVEDFESAVFTWLPIIADPLAPDTLDPFPDIAYRGGRSARYVFGQATDNGVRGFYKAPTRQFLPVVFSEQLLAQSGLRIGEPVIIKLAGRQIVVIIMDTVRHFPTMSGRNDNFIITDVDLLEGHVNVLGSAYIRAPNEVYIRAASDDDEQVQQLRDELNVSILAQLTDRVSLLDRSNVSPAMSAGWRTLAVFSLVVAVVAAASGYVSYLLLSDAGRRMEVAFLQSMGLSRVQLIALIAFEQAAIISISLGLGTWAGFQMSRLLVSPLALSEAGGRIVPPFLLLTDWTLLAPVYAAMIVSFVGILTVVNWRALHVNLAALARLEA